MVSGASGPGGESRLPLQALWELVRDIRYAMLTSRDADGRLRSRPMTTLNRASHEDVSLWFFATRGSSLAEDLQSDPHVGVTYADPAKDHYVSVNGRARFVEDRPRRDDLWTPRVLAWFPQGPADPALVLVEVRIEQAEYWDVHSSRMVQLLLRAKAKVTGAAIAPVAEHHEIDLG
jgi:general stress protein 26